ncbi:amidohydrolase [Erythrobacter dokdonensis]|uniref:Twin-arginine translocation pathway signal n=1 Tax=Erythrobacter dokdonensis DSW-74 TaxID=1300349 RepID=A0A1A7BL02_9SPHN|nr:amidohydrolase family protein [Erythrobacter dokdonensis]OBV12162.1 Twin-arginine translocation pathway signal [Erythrobacter dokdonensis DSW-74]
MNEFSRGMFVGAGLGGAADLSPLSLAAAQSRSLQDVGGSVLTNSQATIYTAREIVTLDPVRAKANAVAVIGDRIGWVGSLEDLVAALTMSSEILSIEDWVLPTGTVKAVRNKKDFIERLTQAVSRGDPAEPLLTWGYHPAFYGELTRAELDKVSPERPVIVWGRSCHEMFLNTAALALGKVTREVVDGFSASAKEQSSFEKGHFYEQGLFAVLPFIAGFVASPERLRAGLELIRDYMHAKGITFGNEPGSILAKPVQDGVNAVFSSPDMPFRWSFMPDGKSIVDKFADDAQVIPETEKLASWYGGMTGMTTKQVKLFADGAIYSQLMQVREPYLDGHEGEWMTDKEVFERAFRIYWDADYQIHIHVNGDAGLELLLDTLEANLRRRPRHDHRTVLVHFAVSGADQVERIARLGAIVSGNPYYVSALADQYGKVGLGPERADAMVRLGDLDRGTVRWSLHSDMPMAPGDPLFLMWCAVNRITSSGRVAGAEQRVSALDALRGVTIEAAHSLRLEDEIGSITPGKRANLTVLDANPLTVAPMDIRHIGVWGTVMEGRVLPVEGVAAAHRETAGSRLAHDPAFSETAFAHALKAGHAGHPG